MQLYSEMIGNVMTDARSTGKYYHCKCSGCKRIKFGLCHALFVVFVRKCFTKLSVFHITFFYFILNFRNHITYLFL